jgi:TonB-linked SusC/RagA family outer membrane protein
MKHSLQKMSLLFLMLLLSAPSLMAQFKVTGTVTDAVTNEPLVGAIVVAKGGGRGATTDINGKYALELPGTSGVISISYTGFETTERSVSSSDNIMDVAMNESANSLDEVVISGLASNIKRANAATSVARINSDELTGATRAPTLEGNMHGKIIGANIQSNSGAPGGGFSVKLRGISSIVGSSEPLYVIDGIIVNNAQFNTGAGTRAFNGAVTTANAGSQDQATNRISDINPADIESIDVLKGPAAAAIYGTRANAGVIVITTKRGKAGKSKISLSQDVGFATAINLLESEDWTSEKIDQFGGFYGVGLADAKAIFAEYQANGSNKVDYDKEFFGETGRIYNTNLNISGGNDKTRFYVAGGLNDETGIQKNTGFKRYSIRANIDHRFNDWIDFKVSSAYYNSSSSRSFLGNDNNGVSIGYTIAYMPNFLDVRPIVRDGAVIYPANPGIGQNPFEVRDRMENKESTNRFLNSGTLNVNLIRKENSSLKFSFTGGVDYLLAQPTIYAPEDMQYQRIRANPGASRFANNEAFYTYIQNFLTYTYKVGQVNMTTQAGILKNIQKTDESWIQGEGLLPGQRNPATAQVIISNTFRSESQDVASDFSQSFNWQDKVILNAGIRFDKSSLHGDNEKWWPFPRFSGAVNLTNFEFLSDNKVLSQLKPRFAFGRTGGVSSYGALYSTLVPVNYGGNLGVNAPTVAGNAGLGPETAQELEVGIDFGFLKNRISVEASYYDKRLNDFLFAYTLAPSTGVTSVALYPVGDMSNKGIELGVNIAAVKSRNFDWNTGIQFWNNKTKIEKLNIPAGFVPTSGFGNFGRNRLVEGLSPTLWWGRDSDGRSPVYFDADGKSYLGTDPKPSGRLRDAQPAFQMSWSNNITLFKRLEVSMFWHTSQGNYLSSLTRELKDEGGTTYDWSQPSGEQGSNGENIPNGLSSRLFGNPGYSSTSYILDASYIRLREAAIYYTLPGVAKSTKNAISNLRIGVSGQNMVTIFMVADNKKIMYDPEASNFGNRSIGTGVDLTPFPSAKRVFLHLQADF